MKVTVGHLEPNGDVVIDETGFLPLLFMLIKPTVKAVQKAQKRGKLPQQVTKLGMSAAKGATKGAEKGAKDAERTP